MIDDSIKQIKNIEDNDIKRYIEIIITQRKHQI